MRFRTLLILSICASMLGEGEIRAQLYAPTADYQTWINYTGSNPLRVRVFVFNQNESNWGTHWGRIEAVSVDSTTGWTFQWSVLDQTNFQFVDTLAPLINVQVAVLDNLNFGCYRIRMQKGSVDTSFIAWVIINPLRFHLVKTDDGYVKEFEYTCDFLDLRAIPRNDTKFDADLRYVHNDYFLCPHPYTGDLYRLSNELKCNWEGNDGSSYVTTKPQLRIYQPPAQDTRYKVDVTDAFGNTASDQITYRTINTRADFKIFLAEDTIAGSFKSRYKEATEGEARLWARFENTSKNGVNFTWRLSDLMLNAADSAYYLRTTTDSTATIEDVQYSFPRTYKITLISESPRFCVDSITKEIVIKPSKMGDMGKNAFPKVITPNNDGIHDYFYIKVDNSDTIQSIEYLSLRIYNSRGSKVYEYKGKMADGWKGWDGKTLWGLDAPTGIYYYYFEAKGYGPFASTSGNNTEQSAGTTTGPRKVSGKGYVYLIR
ncbi:MAG TPA: gliding motility-associated C-terminal domain-containing protein [Bacteroidales bacterium]|nr:gliding motility-associated C-terminal domain-containing protein [Bacteroidales bacterium]